MAPGVAAHPVALGDCPLDQRRRPPRGLDQLFTDHEEDRGHAAAGEDVEHPVGDARGRAVVEVSETVGAVAVPTGPRLRPPAAVGIRRRAVSRRPAARSSRWSGPRGEVEQVPERLDGADVAGILPRVGRRVQRSSEPHVWRIVPPSRRTFSIGR